MGHLAIANVPYIPNLCLVKDYTIYHFKNNF